MLGKTTTINALALKRVAFSRNQKSLDDRAFSGTPLIH
jgi:hypothetical protein